MNPDIRVCSYNLGAKVYDYHAYFPEASDFREQSKELETDEERAPLNELETSIEVQYTKVRRIVSEQLVTAADVFCLQEVMTSTRPEVEKMIHSKFEIIWVAPKTDCMVAINKERFNKIENRSFYTNNRAGVAVAVGVDASSGKKMAFISAHIAGFHLENTTPNDIEEKAKAGDDECKEIAAVLKNLCKDCELIVFGGDFNVSPEIHKKRFSNFENEGFETHRTNKPTNLTTHRFMASKLFDRELDYFQVKKNFSFLSFLKNLFNRKKVDIQVVKGDFSPGLNLNTNSSDHIPIYLKISHIASDSLGSQILKRASELKNWISKKISA